MNMFLENAGPDEFVIRGGICDGAHIRIERMSAAYVEGRPSYLGQARAPDGWRVAGNGKANIRDVEEGTVLRPLIDTPETLSHLAGEDGRNALEQFFAVEAVTRMIERANYPPLLPWTDLQSVRSVRPEFPEPPGRVELWPSGKWTADYADVWKLSDGPLSKARTQPSARVRMAALRLAMERLAPDHECQSWFTEDSRALEKYGWYAEIPDITGISVGSNVRKAAETPGVHFVRRLTVSVSARGCEEVRRLRVPLWLIDRKRLIVEQGVEPQVEDVAALFEALQYGLSGSHDYEADAVKLLGQAGERAIHEEMERKFTQELSQRVGPGLEVTVSIRPKEIGDA